MGKINKERLLQPVSEDEPCGEDLSDLTEYYVLEELVKGKEETQFSEAEPPDWPKVLTTATELLEQGKELWVVVHLMTALVVLDGAKGLSDGLDLLNGIIERFWDDLYPELDDDDENPAEQRMNILNNLTAVGSMFFEGIKDIPLCKSRQLGTFTWRHILLADGEISPAKDQEVPQTALIEAAIKESDPEFISEVHQALSQSVQYIQEMDQWLTERVGSFDNTSKVMELAGLLERMLGKIQSVSHVDHGADEQGDGDENLREQMPVADSDAAAPPHPASQGEITSQRDVIVLLNHVSLWYAAHEPSSPVSLLVDRARNLVGKTFRQIIKEIADQAENQVTELFGEANEEPGKPVSIKGNSAEIPISSQTDVIKIFDKIHTWYMIFEPSSPVPLFIERAKALVGKNFIDIIENIAAEAMDNVTRLLSGMKNETE